LDFRASALLLVMVIVEPKGHLVENQDKSEGISFCSFFQRRARVKVKPKSAQLAFVFPGKSHHHRLRAFDARASAQSIPNGPLISHLYRRYVD
jgi:hypothetical protein